MFEENLPYSTCIKQSGLELLDLKASTSLNAFEARTALFGLNRFRMHTSAINNILTECTRHLNITIGGFNIQRYL